MKIICIGDSITYGLGVPVEDSWTQILRQNTAYNVINRGINGDTSGGMLARFQKDVIDERPDLVFIMGGANDFMMGCETAVVKANILAMVHQARAAKINVVIGIEISSNLLNIREDWKTLVNFQDVDDKLGEMHLWLYQFCKVFQVPFVDLYQNYRRAILSQEKEFYIDGVHPNKKGHRLIADIIMQSNIFEVTR